LVSTLFVTLYGSFGLFGPFAATLLQQAGLTLSGATLFLSLTRLIRVMTTPIWTGIVDARSTPRDVLLLTSLPVALLFVAMLFTAPGWPWLVAYAMFIAFRGPAISLTDVLALDTAASAQVPYGRLRLWGTVGYCAGALAAGAMFQRHATQYVLLTTLTATILASITLLGVHRGPIVRRQGIWSDLKLLLARPRYRLLLMCSALHQMGLSAYDNLYSPWAAEKTSGFIAGLGVVVGGLSEVLFMAVATPWVVRMGAARTFALSFVASGLRWILLGRCTSVSAILGLQVLHALSFGAFYIAAVAMVEQEARGTVRASAQGIFTTISFGVATGVSLLISSALVRHGGIKLVFDFAASASALAAVIALVGLRSTPTVDEK
jgi:PPP family 3-phenylpropionic acid transporter